MDTSYKLALKAVQRLVAHGYIAYFAGGWVRDMCMGHPSEDIDIATNAQPEVILDLFSNTILVGLAFGVVVVTIEGHSFEIASFRKDFDYHDGRKPSRIVFATPEEDALRRDFTINGMFFDPIDEKIYDFVGGESDIKHGVIRAIGDPVTRFREDRLRMIRAVRFSARFDFFIDEETKEAIKENSDTLFPAVAVERVWQELDKMARFPRFDSALLEMHRLGLLTVIFPELQDIHFQLIKESVSSFSHFPENIPLVLFLFRLFDHVPFPQFEGALDRLKVSRKTKQLAQLAYSAKTLLHEEDLVSWCHFLAHQDARQVFSVLELKDQEKEKVAELEKRLSSHIVRIAQKDPLVTAKDLMDLGIHPGKEMGELLKQAERFSIEQDLNDVKSVLRVLCK